MRLSGEAVPEDDAEQPLRRHGVQPRERGLDPLAAAHHQRECDGRGHRRRRHRVGGRHRLDDGNSTMAKRGAEGSAARIACCQSRNVARGTPVSRQNAVAVRPLLANAARHAVFSAVVHRRRRRLAGATAMIAFDMGAKLPAAYRPATTSELNAYVVSCRASCNNAHASTAQPET